MLCIHAAQRQNAGIQEEEIVEWRVRRGEGQACRDVKANQFNQVDQGHHYSYFLHACRSAVHGRRSDLLAPSSRRHPASKQATA